MILLYFKKVIFFLFTLIIKKTGTFSLIYLKKKKNDRLLSIHITVDDFGEQMNVVKSNHSILIVKGRHYQISTALLLQRFRLASPTIRYNAHALYVHKLSNMADLKALAEEFAALLGDEQTFIEIYKRATAEKFGFLYITMGPDPIFFFKLQV